MMVVWEREVEKSNGALRREMIVKQRLTELDFCLFLPFA